MSNNLDISLIEFKVRGSDEILCGILAVDDYATYAYRAAGTWDKFKAEFPTIDDVMDKVVGSGCFEGLSECYRIENGEVISLSNDDEEEGDFVDYTYSGVYMTGHEGLYN